MKIDPFIFYSKMTRQKKREEITSDTSSDVNTNKSDHPQVKRGKIELSTDERKWEKGNDMDS